MRTMRSVMDLWKSFLIFLEFFVSLAVSFSLLYILCKYMWDYVYCVLFSCDWSLADVNSFYFPRTGWLIELLTLTPYGWCFVLIENYMQLNYVHNWSCGYMHVVYFQLLYCTLKSCISLILLLFWISNWSLQTFAHNLHLGNMILNVILLGHT